MTDVDPFAGYSIRVMMASVMLRDVAMHDLANDSHLLVAATAWIMEKRPSTHTLEVAVMWPDMNPETMASVPDELVDVLIQTALARRAQMGQMDERTAG